MCFAILAYCAVCICSELKIWHGDQLVATRRDVITPMCRVMHGAKMTLFRYFLPSFKTYVDEFYNLTTWNVSSMSQSYDLCF